MHDKSILPTATKSGRMFARVGHFHFGNDAHLLKVSLNSNNRIREEGDGSRDDLCFESVRIARFSQELLRLYRVVWIAFHIRVITPGFRRSILIACLA